MSKIMNVEEKSDEHNQGCGAFFLSSIRTTESWERLIPVSLQVHRREEKVCVDKEDRRSLIPASPSGFSEKVNHSTAGKRGKTEMRERKPTSAMSIAAKLRMRRKLKEEAEEEMAVQKTLIPASLELLLKFNS